MTIAAKIAALLPVVRRQDIEELPPFERRRLADLCRHIASIADPPAQQEQRSGVLVELKNYQREG